MKKESLNLLREFKKQWYPARDLPKIEDFIAWLENNGHRIVRSNKGGEPFSKNPQWLQDRLRKNTQHR